jgi:hypothetical protein
MTDKEFADVIAMSEGYCKILAVLIPKVRQGTATPAELEAYGQALSGLAGTGTRWPRGLPKPGGGTASWSLSSPEFPAAGRPWRPCSKTCATSPASRSSTSRPAVPCGSPGSSRLSRTWVSGAAEAEEEKP